MNVRKELKNWREVFMRRLHFVVALLGALVFLNILSMAQIKIEVQGDKVPQQQQATPTQITSGNVVIPTQHHCEYDISTWRSYS